MGNSDVLRNLQLMQLELLKAVDCICKKHNIRYALFAGTALGAVRHKGYIPWDDDLDIIMPREDYQRFLKIAPDEISSEYYLQSEFSEHWPMQFSKLRKNGTAFIERYIPKDKKTHMGVYIDIFPCDNLSSNKVMQFIQFASSKVVIASALDRRGYLTDSLVKKMCLYLSRLCPWKLFWKIAKFESKRILIMYIPFLVPHQKSHSVFPRKWIEETENLQFEDGLFPVSSHYDEMLTVLYGDYMTPTPVEQRGIKIHGEIVDLENSYEKYEGIQKMMDFKEFTRSIR